MLLSLLGCVLQDPTTVALPLPDLCREPPPPPQWPSLPDGSHIWLDAELPRALAAPLLPLPASTLLELIEEDARRRGGALEVRRPAPPLLVRGGEADLAAARGLVGDLAAASAEREIELEVWLAPVLARSRDAAPPEAGVEHDAATVRSGGAALLGAREVRSFVARYDVEVATGSGAADPAPGEIAYGRTVHLTAWRVSGGREVLIAGLLDLADPPVVERMEPLSADVGELELARLSVCQVAFGGRVASGDRLRVTIAGAPLSQPDWTLWIEARTRADGAREWSCADLALLETEVDEPPLPSPGAGLAGLVPAHSRGRIAGASPAASIFGAVESRLRGADARAPRPLLAFSPGVLIARSDAADAWREVLAVTAALESERVRTRELSLADGPLEVRLPVAAGLPARVLAGEERTALVDFDAEIAAETWMGVPRVARAFDGVCVQGLLEDETFAARWWRASSAAEPLAPIDTTHGMLRARPRSLAQGHLGARTGAEPGSVATAPALRLESP